MVCGKSREGRLMFRGKIQKDMCYFAVKYWKVGNVLP